MAEIRVKKEGHYTIKIVDKLPKRGNSNWLYAIRDTKIDILYEWNLKGYYDEISIGGEGSFSGFTNLETDYGVTLSTVATTNNYNDLDNLPVLGETFEFIEETGSILGGDIELRIGDVTSSGEELIRYTPGEGYFKIGGLDDTLLERELQFGHREILFTGLNDDTGAFQRLSLTNERIEFYAPSATTPKTLRTTGPAIGPNDFVLSGDGGNLTTSVNNIKASNDGNISLPTFSFEGYNETGTRATNDLVGNFGTILNINDSGSTVTLGDSSNPVLVDIDTLSGGYFSLADDFLFYSSNNIELEAINGVVELLNNTNLVFKDALFGTTITRPSLNSNNTINLSNKTGTMALLEDIVSFGKWSETFGDGILTTFTISHNLNDSDISSILIREVSTGEVIDADKFIVDGDNIRLEFNTPPTTNQYRVTIKV